MEMRAVAFLLCLPLAVWSEHTSTHLFLLGSLRRDRSGRSPFLSGIFAVFAIAKRSGPLRATLLRNAYELFPRKRTYSLLPSDEPLAVNSPPPREAVLFSPTWPPLLQLYGGD